MSKFIVVVLSFLLCSLSFSQTLVPQDANVVYENVARPCLYIVVDPNTDELKEAWVDYLSKNHDVKLKGTGFLTNKDVLTAKGIVITQVSPKMMDLYTEIIEEGEQTSMKLFVAFGYDIYINNTEYPMEYEALKKMMSNFLNQYIPLYYNDKIKIHQKEVDALAKDQAKLAKSIEKNTEKIEKTSAKIEQMTEENKKHRTELDEVESKLKVETEKLNRFKGKLNTL